MKKFAKRIGFVGVNFLLIWHVFAIAISPSSMPPASPLLADASKVARPYNQALFLNHGYHYFAPNPGASSLLEFETQPDNDVPQIERIPDPKAYAPRLRYHRFFMLAENVWAFGDDAQQDFIEAYARHFSQKLKSDSISVVSVSHNPAPMRRIMAGGDLQHPTSYFREPLADFEFSANGKTIRKSFRNLSAAVSSVELSPTPMSPKETAASNPEQHEQSSAAQPEANSNAGLQAPISITPESGD